MQRRALPRPNDVSSHRLSFLLPACALLTRNSSLQITTKVQIVCLRFCSRRSPSFWGNSK